MLLLKRFRNLFTADAHAVLDLMEDSHALLKQSLRDMEEQLKQQSHALAILISNKDKLSKQQDLKQRELEKITANLDVCFESDNQELAKKLIKKRLYLEKQQVIISEKITNNAEVMSLSQNTLESNQAMFEDMKQQESALVLDQKIETMPEVNQTINEISQDDVEVAFLHELKRRGAL
jgi:phage shock protein A